LCSYRHRRLGAQPPALVAQRASREDGGGDRARRAAATRGELGAHQRRAGRRASVRRRTRQPLLRVHASQDQGRHRDAHEGHSRRARAHRYLPAKVLATPLPLLIEEGVPEGRGGPPKAALLIEEGVPEGRGGPPKAALLIEEGSTSGDDGPKGGVVRRRRPSSSSTLPRASAAGGGQAALRAPRVLLRMKFAMRSTPFRIASVDAA